MFDIVGMIRGPILASTEWNGVYWELFGLRIASVLRYIATAFHNIRSGWNAALQQITVRGGHDMADSSKTGRL